MVVIVVAIVAVLYLLLLLLLLWLWLLLVMWFVVTVVTYVDDVMVVFEKNVDLSKG